MNRKVVTFSLVMALIGTTYFSKAQVGGFLKDKTKNAVLKGLKRGEEEKKAEEQQKAEEQNPKESAADAYTQKKMMGWMGLNNVKFDPAYTFNSSMKMDFETLDSAATEVFKGSYTFFFDKDSKNFAMEFEAINKETGKKEKSLIVFDYKNMAMLMLTDKDGQKSGLAMAMQPDSSQQTNTQEKTTEPVKQKDLSAHKIYYKPTGKTKKILGYPCKEYVYESTEGRIVLWATNDVKYDYSQAYEHMQGFQYLTTEGAAPLLGTVLEMHFKDANSNARADFWMREFNVNSPRTFSVSDYQMIGVGGNKKK